MAFNVSYIFSARDQYSSVARKIKKETKSLKKEFKGLRGQLARTNKAFKKTSSSMSSGFRRMAAAAIGFFGAREFIRVGSEFQNSIADLSAITGATGQNLDAFKTNILEMAKSAVTSQDQVSLAVTTIASLKEELLKTDGAVEKVTEQVLLLANASGVTVPEAVRASVGALNQFNKGADQASRFVNVIAAGAKIGASLVGETAEALKNVGAVSAQFNLSFEETNALLQVLAKNEIKGAEAGTKLRTVLSRLEKIAKGEIAPSVIGVTASLEALASAGLTNVQIIKEFGDEGLAAVLILRENVDLFKRFTKELTGTSVAQEQASKRLNVFSKKMQLLGIVIKDKLIKVFEKAEPVFRKITLDLVKFIESITPKQIEAFANGLKKFTLASAEVVKQLSTRLVPVVKDFFVTIKTANASSFVADLLTIAEAIRIILIPVKILAAFLKGLFIAFDKLTLLLTGNFKKAFDTSIVEALTLGGKFLGVFEKTKAPTVEPTTMNSQAQIDINIKDREGVVESVKTKRNGNTGNMKLGVNMETGA